MATEQQEPWTSWTFGEAATALGQTIEFECRGNADRDAIREFFRNNIRLIRIPSTHPISVNHGGYGNYSRYRIKQLKYAGGGHPGHGGYIEVLEIANAPDGRAGFILNVHRSDEGNAFSEWETVADALAAWEKNWGKRLADMKLDAYPGFKRFVACGALRPWFYATSDETLIGGFVFPEGLQQDEVYRFGQRVVTYDPETHAPRVKICMGTRFVTERPRWRRDEVPVGYRIVYFDDGSSWDELSNPGLRPRPLRENEAWAVQAREQFDQALAGKLDNFVIDFIDGMKFVGRLVRPKRDPLTAEGRYDLVVRDKSGKVRSGWLDFEPKPDCPTVRALLAAKIKEGLEHFEVKKFVPKKGGKRWAGAFFSRSP